MISRSLVRVSSAVLTISLVFNLTSAASGSEPIAGTASISPADDDEPEDKDEVKSSNLHENEVVLIILMVVVIVAGMKITILFCVCGKPERSWPWDVCEMRSSKTWNVVQRKDSVESLESEIDSGSMV